MLCKQLQDALICGKANMFVAQLTLEVLYCSVPWCQRKSVRDGLRIKGPELLRLLIH